MTCYLPTKSIAQHHLSHIKSSAYITFARLNLMQNIKHLTSSHSTSHAVLSIGLHTMSYMISHASLQSFHLKDLDITSLVPLNQCVLVLNLLATHWIQSVIQGESMCFSAKTSVIQCVLPCFSTKSSATHHISSAKQGKSMCYTK